jgi:hypothetical protein
VRCEYERILCLLILVLSSARLLVWYCSSSPMLACPATDSAFANDVVLDRYHVGSRVVDMVTYCDCECESCAIHSMLTQGERGCREGRECWSLAGKRKRGRSVVAWAKTRWDVLISVVLSQLWIHHPAPSLVCLNHTPYNHGPSCTATKAFPPLSSLPDYTPSISRVPRSGCLTRPPSTFRLHSRPARTAAPQSSPPQYSRQAGEEKVFR